MTQETFLKRYESYAEDVQEYMKMFSNALIEKYAEIPDDHRKGRYREIGRN